MIPSSNALRQIKFEAVHRNRLSTDVLIDTMSLKNSMNYNCIELQQNDSITGYIQDIFADPFGFIFFSQIQVFLTLNI